MNLLYLMLNKPDNFNYCLVRMMEFNRQSPNILKPLGCKAFCKYIIFFIQGMKASLHVLISLRVCVKTKDFLSMSVYVELNFNDSATEWLYREILAPSNHWQFTFESIRKLLHGYRKTERCTNAWNLNSVGKEKRLKKFILWYNLRWHNRVKITAHKAAFYIISYNNSAFCLFVLMRLSVSKNLNQLKENFLEYGRIAIKFYNSI